MFRSILLTALRNIRRNLSFSIINLVGLSVSMSLGLLIILIVKDQYSFDTFHADSDRVYRINTRAIRVAGGSEDYASAPLPIATVLQQDYDIIESVVRINKRLSGDVIWGSVNVPVSGMFVDPSFLQVFNFSLQRGNIANALTQPNGLVITQQTAERIFGKAEPLGQTVSIADYGEFMITGVLAEFGKTHFEFQMLGSTAAMPALERDGVITPSLDNFNNYYGNYVYVKLKHGKSPDALTKALSQVYEKHYNGLKLETRDKGYDFFIQPLTAITPGPPMSNQMGNGMPDILLLMMSVLSGIVMIMACFNYTNLLIAKSLARAREIGVRKVVGAQRFQVFIQFVGESVVFALFALLISYVLLQLLKPGFQQLSLAKEFDISLQEDIRLYLIFLGFAVLVGCIAGLLPAGYLSAFKPVNVLKDTNVRLYSRLTLRKLLLVTQFAFSLIFIMVVLIIYRQIDFMLTTDYGIRDQAILNIRLQGNDYAKLASQIQQVPGVVQTSGVSHSLGTWADRASDYKISRDDEPFVMRDFVVDEHYLNNLGVTFLAGRNFRAAEEGAYEKHVILNEQALTNFNFEDAPSAIGQTLYTDDSVMLTVIGVVKDFHFRPLSYSIGPVAFRYNSSQLSIMSVLIDPAQHVSIMIACERIFKSIDPVHTFNGQLMADEIDQAYSSAGFTDILTIIGYIAFLSITLACLGMLGMAMYSTKTRVKEIGIRKVMGASVHEVTILLSRSFMLLIAIAVVLAVPVSYWLGTMMLETYAYKISVSVGIILSGISIVVVLALITVCSQTIRAARNNPVKALRYE